ncbi:MAG: hypothetical protein Q4B14_05380 [Clostridia bacterium]|nr:hypothetical protein [Clostridia bacterium]
MKKRKMKKVFSMRLSSMLLVMSILTTCVAAGTFAASGDTLGMYGYASVGREFKVTLNGNEPNESIIAKSGDSSYTPDEKAYWDIFSGKTTATAVEDATLKTTTDFDETAVNQIGPGEKVYGKIVVENAGGNAVKLDDGNSVIKIKAYTGTATDTENLKVPFVVKTTAALSGGANAIALDTNSEWTTITGTEDAANNLKTYDIRDALMATGVSTDAATYTIQPGKKLAVWVEISWPTEGDYYNQAVTEAWTELYFAENYEVAETVSDINSQTKPGFVASVEIKATTHTG